MKDVILVAAVAVVLAGAVVIALMLMAAFLMWDASVISWPVFRGCIIGVLIGNLVLSVQSAMGWLDDL